MEIDKELRGWKAHCVYLQDKCDRLELENSRLQAVIDEANAQEPLGEVYKCSNTGTGIDFVVYSSIPEGETKLYARPIPAQQSQAVADCDHLDPWQIAEGTKCDCNKSPAISKAETATRITEQDAREIVTAWAKYFFDHDETVAIPDFEWSHNEWKFILRGILNKLNEGKNHGN